MSIATHLNVPTCANVVQRDVPPHAECNAMQSDADCDMTLSASDAFECGAWANVRPHVASLPSWQCGLRCWFLFATCANVVRGDVQPTIEMQWQCAIADELSVQTAMLVGNTAYRAVLGPRIAFLATWPWFGSFRAASQSTHAWHGVEHVVGVYWIVTIST